MLPTTIDSGQSLIARHAAPRQYEWLFVLGSDRIGQDVFGTGGEVLARSHGLVFSSAAGGAHWQIAIRCPSLPFPSVKVHQAAVLVRRFRFSMVAGCVDQNIKDPYGNTLHLHEVTFMLMAEYFHRVCG